MADFFWLVSVTVGGICFGAGLLAWMYNPRSKAAGVFLLAMIAALMAMMTSPLIQLIDRDNSETISGLSKIFASSANLATVFLWELTIVFPVERKVSFKPPNAWGLLLLAAPIVSVVVSGVYVGPSYADPDIITLNEAGNQLMFVHMVAMILIATGLVLGVRERCSDQQWKSAKIFMLGLWVVMFGMMPSVVVRIAGDLTAGDIELSNMILIAAIGGAGIIFLFSIFKGTMRMEQITTEITASSEKASYRLLHKRVYLVKEPKPEFSFKVFADILKGRCFDCENDDSFPCESLECASCKLPCPCRECKKYKSRPQGLIITRQFPDDVRRKHFIQTTPITWLSTVAGKDNMDPAKLSLLTDYLVNFMERSQNGVVLVDGLEYLVTSNDFGRVLKAVDRWTESAMTSASRLIISIDPRAFDPKELALLEKNKEVVRPDAGEAWQIIPERI